MAPHASRPSLSITLPSNFEFHYSDGQPPTTPDRREEQLSALDPPPPPRPHAFKVRRKRAAIPEFQKSESESLMSDTVIPTIEMSEAASQMSSPMLQATPSAHGLLAPLPAFQRLVTPPKTPAARSYPSFSSPVESPANEWALINDSRSKLQPSFERSGSVCSSLSDSSVSSCGSSAFSAPNNGSCTSPESEATDPFFEDDMPKNADIVTSPDLHSTSPTNKRVKVHRHIKWTQAMDDHLWMTYMQYLADPRVTPFKMLPGTSPPLGVCSRVASKARRTWSSHRATTSGIDAVMTSDGDRMQREGSPDTIRPNAKDAKQPQWPRSDSNTRRRLRSLCKRKPSLSAHYQRLLHTRSPSPFPSSSSADRTSEAPTAFASHDMKISLVTATAPSMQPEGPLAQLTSDEAPLQQPQARPQSQRSSRPADWFARIPRSQAHQKSLSLQSGSSFSTGTESAAFLASPFDDVASRSHLLQSMNATKSLGRSNFKDGKGPSLDSPVELSGAPTLPRSLKRRFRSDEDKPKRPGVQDVFGPHADNGGIMRNRGFSVGAVRATDNLAKLFAPPVLPVDHEMTEAPAVPPVPEMPDPGAMGSRSVPRRLAEPVPRLGSPFTETANCQFNTFPRSYIPSPTNPQPFQQRLRELAAHGAANQPR